MQGMKKKLKREKKRKLIVQGMKKKLEKKKKEN
jgi:hypothetical protein